MLPRILSRSPQGRPSRRRPTPPTGPPRHFPATGTLPLPLSPALATGASGLLGGAIAATLIGGGEDVIALTRDPTAGDVDPRAQPLVADITDRATLQHAIAHHGVTAVFHLAAQATVEAAISD